MTEKHSKLLLERLEYLHSDMYGIATLLKHNRPDKAAELAGAAEIVQEWIDSIKKEGQGNNEPKKVR